MPARPVMPNLSESHHNESWGLQDLIRSYPSRFDEDAQEAICKGIAADVAHILKVGIENGLALSI